jgi:hypothetical protein
MLKNTKKNDYSLIPKKELKQLLEQGLNYTEIGKIYNKNLHYVRTICKLYDLTLSKKVSKCLKCNNQFSYSASKNQKYCSDKCRSAHWPILYPEKFKKHSKKSRLKNNPIKCKYCKILIPDSARKSGVTYCSDVCRAKNRKNQNYCYRSNISTNFIKYKKDIGCQNCGYNKCGASLDFHHVDPTTKSRRISSGLWNNKTHLFETELNKCILLCKNCHYEAHSGVLEILRVDNKWNCQYKIS